eukprot:11606-Heterococcus_DN1.PRE.3
MPWPPLPSLSPHQYHCGGTALSHSGVSSAIVLLLLTPKLQIATATTAIRCMSVHSITKCMTLMNKHREWLYQLASMPSAANTRLGL